MNIEKILEAGSTVLLEKETIDEAFPESQRDFWEHIWNKNPELAWMYRKRDSNTELVDVIANGIMDDNPIKAYELICETGNVDTIQKAREKIVELVDSDKQNYWAESALNLRLEHDKRLDNLPKLIKKDETLGKMLVDNFINYKSQNPEVQEYSVSYALQIVSSLEDPEYTKQVRDNLAENNPRIALKIGISHGYEELMTKALENRERGVDFDDVLRAHNIIEISEFKRWVDEKQPKTDPWSIYINSEKGSDEWQLVRGGILRTGIGRYHLNDPRLQEDTELYHAVLDQVIKTSYQNNMFSDIVDLIRDPDDSDVVIPDKKERTEYIIGKFIEMKKYIEAYNLALVADHDVERVENRMIEQEDNRELYKWIINREKLLRIGGETSMQSTYAKGIARCKLKIEAKMHDMLK